jgi:hypothetical protein
VTIYGRDVSHHQDALPSLAGETFVISRATIGSVVDEKFKVFTKKVRAASKVDGAYHFNWSTSDVDAQCDAFIATIQDVGGVTLKALDVERNVKKHHDGTKTITPRFSQAQATRFIGRFHDRVGEPIGLYASESIYGKYANCGQDWDWVANWSTKPARHYDIWQYVGGVKDHPDDSDLDRFEGTRAQLIKLGGGVPGAALSDVEISMIVPQHLGHCVTTVDARIYPNPDIGATPIASKMPKGSVLRYVAGVSGWRYCEVRLGGIPQYAWLRADETHDTGLALTMIDGPAG